MMNLFRSKAAFEEARNYMPGGVNSPVRSYPHMDCPPPFIASAKGSHITDIDGNTYIDYVGSWGPMILGHAHPRVISAIQKAAENSTSYGAPTVIETELAKLVTAFYPSIEKIRLISSGTEATMSALRAARGYTGRDKILKFAGCYHGHGDSLLVKAGSGAATFGSPDSAGVTKGTAKDTVVVPYNDIDAFVKKMDDEGEEIAAVIVEPVAGNMGCVLPVDGFLETLRRETEKHGTVLIFDEVMCGFRTELHGAQGKYGIIPDMTCLGKIIGGGLPAAAYGGKRDIMNCMAPDGSVYHRQARVGLQFHRGARPDAHGVLRENVDDGVEFGAQAAREHMEAVQRAEAGRQVPGYADAAKKLSETPAGGTNALEALLWAAGPTGGGML